MPIMLKMQKGTEGLNTGHGHFLTEDPRPGHNIMYIGATRDAYDSISLKRLWGLNGTFTTSGSDYYGGAVDQKIQDNDGEVVNCGWAILAGAFPPGVGRNQWNDTSSGNTAYWSNVPMTGAWNMDPDNQHNQIGYRDNGDGTSRILVTSNRMDARSPEAYVSGYQYHAIADNQELYEVAPDFRYNHTTTQGVHGPIIGYSNLDGVNSGWIGLNLYRGSFATYSSLYTIPQGVTQTTETTGTGVASNGYYAQSVGISRVDGLPIFLEMKQSTYSPHISFNKYNGSSWTVLLSEYSTGNNTTPWTYFSSYAHSNSVKIRPYTDGFYRCASNWFTTSTEVSAGNDYYYSFQPFVDGSDELHFFVYRWDRATDTFVGAGTQGPSTQYAGINIYTATGGTNYDSEIDVYFDSPIDSGITMPTVAEGSGQGQIVAGLWTDVHGYTSGDGSSETPHNPDNNPSGFIFWSTFPSCALPSTSGYANRSKARTIVSHSTQMTTSGRLNNTAYVKSYTVVPETPLDWVWLDSGKTCIAAVCQNNTYIYQYRKGTYVSSGTYTSGSSKFAPDTSPSTSTFNVSSNGYQTGWVHTATIPYQVQQIGIDKHDRIWYVTWEASGATYDTSTPERFFKQLWLLTDQTPHKVNLTGNVTTDTINHTGSNIDKTLTIEALNFKGQRLAKTITLSITGTDARFDNGNTTKNVTTSSSATVNETITITGSGTFNITAAFGS